MPNPQGNYSMEDLKRMAQSEAGQQLFSLLQQTQGEKLQSAMDYAAAGDYRQVKEALSAFMESPEAKALLGKMRG